MGGESDENATGYIQDQWGQLQSDEAPVVNKEMSIKEDCWRSVKFSKTLIKNSSSQHSCKYFSKLIHSTDKITLQIKLEAYSSKDC